MTEIETRLVDLLNFSSAQKPVEFEAAFRQLMDNKVYSAISDKKVEVAHTMFATADQETGTEEVDGEAA